MSIALPAELASMLARVGDAGSPPAPKDFSLPDLSGEQERVLDAAVEGRDVIVDATVGSGKTSTIMAICNELGADKRILYLTYSKLLKHDAQLRVRGAKVQNYHGIVYPHLLRAGIKAGISESIGAFNAAFDRIGDGFEAYDVLVIDEYQDITEEYAELIGNIMSRRPGMQVVMVGDTEQKVNANSTLDTRAFSRRATDNPAELSLTQSFRMGPAMGALLGRAWNKPVLGVNDEQVVRMMNHSEAVGYMQHVDPGDLLVLGKRSGGRMSSALNALERMRPGSFNKASVYASIRERGDQGSYDDRTAVFTTFDSCKGMERPVVFVYDMDVAYLETRLRMSSTDPAIIRNAFLVAASRGKAEIVFVADHTGRFDLGPELLESKTLAQARELAAEADLGPDHEQRGRIGQVPVARFLDLPDAKAPTYRRPIEPSTCFDHTYAENVIAALAHVERTELDPVGEQVVVPGLDGLIDLSPAIGSYVELMYFDDARITWPASLADHRIAYLKERLRQRTKDKRRTDWDDALFMTAVTTEHDRYLDQVSVEVDPAADEAIIARLGEHLPRDARVQVQLGLEGQALTYTPRWAATRFNVAGIADAIHEDRVWELKFTAELAREHFLQAALYQVMSGLEEAVLFNVRTGQRFSVRVPEPRPFLDAVVTCVTRQWYRQFEPETRL